MSQLVSDKVTWISSAAVNFGACAMNIANCVMGFAIPLSLPLATICLAVCIGCIHMAFRGEGDEEAIS